MKTNMGTVDRTLRIIAAIVVGLLYYSGQISGTAAIILGIIALAFLVTSAIGWCPAYTALGLSTKGKSAES